AVRPLAAAAFDVYFAFDAPAWSPDDSRLAFDGVDELVHVVGADGKGERSLAPGRHPVWSPDGTRLTLERTDGTLWLVAADGTSPRRLGAPGCGSRPSWAPDGRRLVYAARACAGERTKVVVLDVDAG